MGVIDQLCVFGKDILTVLTYLMPEKLGNQYGNMHATVIGSFSLDWKLIGHDDKGNAIVRLTVTNDMSAQSLLKLPVIGYSKWWKENVASRMNNISVNGILNTGALSTISMQIEWTTIISNPNN